MQGFLKATGLDLARRGEDPARSQEGRLLHRADRKAGPRHARRARRDSAGDHPHLPVAEIDALGRALGDNQARCTWVRPLHSIIATFGIGDRRAGGREIFHRRHRGRPDHVRPSLHGAGARSRCAASRITRPSSKAAKVVLDPQAPQGHHPGRRQAACLRARASSWSRIRCCSTRSRAWSNGRSC